MEPKFLSKKRNFLENSSTGLLQNNKPEIKSEESPNFLLKLYKILETPEYSEIIHWNETGEYFIVKNLHDFTESILPKFYKHNNYSSFVRQLNMYDFHKKKSVQNEHIFQHKSFIRGQKELIQNIKRKNKKEFHSINNAVIEIQNTNLASNNHDLSMVEYFNNNNHKKATKSSLNNALKFLIKNVSIANERAKNLEDKVEKLGKQNEDFLLQNQTMLQEIIAKSEYNKKLEAVVYFILDIIMKSNTSVKNCGDIKNILITKEHCNCRDEFSKPQIEGQQIGSSGYTSIIPFNEVKCKDHQNQVDTFQKFLENFAQKASNKAPETKTLSKGVMLPMLGSGEEKFNSNNNLCSNSNYKANELLSNSPSPYGIGNQNSLNGIDFSNQLSPIRLRSRGQSFDTIISNNNLNNEREAKRKGSKEFFKKDSIDLMRNSNLFLDDYNNMSNNNHNNEKENNIKDNNSNDNSFSIPTKNVFDLEFNCGGLNNNNDGKDLNFSLNNSNLEDQGLDALGGRKIIDKCFFEDNNCI